MNLSREEAQQILRALDYGGSGSLNRIEGARSILQSRLAEGEQEPVAWLYWDAYAGSRGSYRIDLQLPHGEGAFPVFAAPQGASE